MINLLIADDHKIFREGLCSIFEHEEALNVVAEAETELEVFKAIEDHSIQVILMDISMGESNGIELTQKIKANREDIQILVLSMHNETPYIVKAIEAGALGYLLKNTGKEEMIQAIQAVNKGNTYYSSGVAQQLMNHLTKKNKNKKNTPLSKREIEILQLIASEYTNPEIATKLFISVRTVDTHRRNLLEKLGVKNTVGLVKYAIKNDLLLEE